MTYHNINKEFANNIDKVYNLKCIRCKKAHMSYELMDYCHDCVEEMGDETYGTN